MKTTFILFVVFSMFFICNTSSAQNFADEDWTAQSAVKIGRVKGMPLGAGISGTTTNLQQMVSELSNGNSNIPSNAAVNSRIYIIESIDSKHQCISEPTTKEIVEGDVVEVELKKRIGGSVNADWITNTCAIR